MATGSYSTILGSEIYTRIDDCDLELYLNDATPDEVRHAAICVLRRLGELAPFDMRLYAYPEGDNARIGAERMSRALLPVVLPELRKVAA